MLPLVISGPNIMLIVRELVQTRYPYCALFRKPKLVYPRYIFFETNRPYHKPVKNLGVGIERV
jgi:hypothetical protein